MKLSTEEVQVNIIAKGNGAITEADVLAVCGLVSWQALEGLVGAVVRGEVESAIRLVGELDGGGKDLRRLAVELLERLLEGEIKSRFAGNVVQNKKFSDMLTDVVQRYQNRSIEAAQVMEELVEMAKKFREAAARGGGYVGLGA